MNGVQLYTIVYFGGDIVRLKIRSIISYIGGSTKLNSLRAHSSYGDFVTLLKETSEIYPEDSELQFESQPEQVNNLVHFLFKSAVYTEDPYYFSKEFNIGDLYRDRIKLKNYIRAYAIVNKFNPEHVLHEQRYKIVMRDSFEHTYQLLTSYFAEVRLINPDFVFDIQTTSCKEKRFTRYGVAYTNHVESGNNLILKVSDLPIHVFIKELNKIYSKMSYMYREEAEKSQALLMPWAIDHCESIKFMADLLTCRVRTSRHHFQMASYGRTDSINIEGGIFSCHWWQMMGIPCEHGVRTLSLSNVDRTTRVSEYFTNYTYKAIYENIGILIRGIEQWKILKTDPCVRAPIPIASAGRPRTRRKRRE
ncbi:hypothetical protein GIB67_030754 [Kingdonia uniflora]|uniref:Zinc finger PMZ-type domain-containing protein n=1 Tax=Kingdonia uniflora TaxID=39325 RepID=A0A7J7L2W8_9MAGN|nr:hypothetical protein GIB67_030754 [Kingdonia uniflora]